MNPFSGVDYLHIDGNFSSDELLIRDTVRQFVTERYLPDAAAHFENETFPIDLVPELAELGLLGAHLTGYGCAGLSNVCYGLICQELERGDSGLRSFVSVQGSLCMFPIHAYGSEEQKQRWLPAMAAGKAIGCFGLTEPQGGSNPSNMQTRAVRDGASGWVLNGTKMWITNGSLADVAIVWAQTDDGVRGFLVEKGMAGFSTRDIKHKFSLRASRTSELIFHDCKVSEASRLPKAEGLKGPLSCLTEARYGIAWGVMGAAAACYDAALEYAKGRVVFAKPIAGHQLVQNELVWMLTEVTKGRLLALQVGREKDKHDRFRHQMVSMAK
ncbi:MAG TPA: acyl-CoA dehydrogenase family protein, partial [Planctomycetota bacterium]|nr:acyl-CoA dehydrogenase family protein [Planctomycetota bacterium]